MLIAMYFMANLMIAVVISFIPDVDSAGHVKQVDKLKFAAHFMIALMVGLPLAIISLVRK